MDNSHGNISVGGLGGAQYVDPRTWASLANVEAVIGSGLTDSLGRYRAMLPDVPAPAAQFVPR